MYVCICTYIYIHTYSYYIVVYMYTAILCIHVQLRVVCIACIAALSVAGTELPDNNYRNVMYALRLYGIDQLHMLLYKVVRLLNTKAFSEVF